MSLYLVEERVIGPVRCEQRVLEQSAMRGRLLFDQCLAITAAVPGGMRPRGRLITPVSFKGWSEECLGLVLATPVLPIGTTQRLLLPVRTARIRRCTTVYGNYVHHLFVQRSLTVSIVTLGILRWRRLSATR